MRLAAAALLACSCFTTTQTINGEQRTLHCSFGDDDKHCTDPESNSDRNTRLTRCALDEARQDHCGQALRIAAHLQVVAADYDHSALEHDPEFSRCKQELNVQLSAIELPPDAGEAALVRTARRRAALGDCATSADLVRRIRGADPTYFKRVLADDAFIMFCDNAAPIECGA